VSAVEGEDGRLVADCLDGRPEAFGVLVRKYQDRLFNTIVHLLGSREDAQDAVQDAFVRAFQKLPSFQGDSAFYTWLYRIAVNGALSLRRSDRRPRVSLDQVRETSGHEPVDGSNDSDPTHNLERSERQQLVWDGLRQLSAEHRTVLVLRDIDGHPYEAISEILDCPVGTVRSRLFRARMELRARLAPLFESGRGESNVAKSRVASNEPTAPGQPAVGSHEFGKRHGTAL
jgi:RNA polymerase sigma-70 factor (ECF subfamily)